MATIRGQGAAFRTLVGIYPYATDPSSSKVFDHPAPLRQTVTVGTILSAGATKTTPGQLGLVGGVVSPQIGTIEVADNNFASRAELVLGEYHLLVNVDFMVGAAAADTAVALAAVINTLPGFAASALLAVVSVQYEGSSTDDVELRALHYGAVENFVLTPDTGLMAKGSPSVVSPTLT